MKLGGSGNSSNRQLFALREPPPQRVEIAGRAYRLVRVFKHDFFAATCLYERDDAGEAAMPRVVVKFGRSQPFCGLPMEWMGRWNRDHEEAIYARLAGVEGLPRWGGRVGALGYAIEYLDAAPLDHLPSPPPGFFDRLRKILDAIHDRGIAYGDANKRSNILVGPGGEPYLIDFQISIRTRDDLPLIGAAIRLLVRRMMQKDLYHLYKHKRRMAPAELTGEEESLSRKRGLLHLLHRKLTKPYRSLRRWFLQKQYRSGQLVSPTASMEDHHQPEKETWRRD